MNLRERVRNIVGEESRAGRIFNLVIKFLIVLSLISISVETLPGISEGLKQFLALFETITVAIFTIEYIARIYAAEKRFRFIFSFYGLVDLIAILPYYLVVGLDLRSLRVFRLFRAARLLKFTRYSDALDRLVNAFRSIRMELTIFVMMVLALLYLAAVGIYYFEYPEQPDAFKSVFHSLWWAIITITHVGYGDVYPVTAGGRIFTFFILMIGLLLLAVPTGLISSAMTRMIRDE